MITFGFALLVLNVMQDTSSDVIATKVIATKTITGNAIPLSLAKNCAEQNDVQFMVGFQLLDDGETKLALSHFEKMISQRTVKTIGYTGRGLVRWGEGDLVSAIKDLSHAIELEPDSKLAYRVRAFCNLELNKFDDAINDGENLLRLDSADSMGYFTIAMSLERKKLYHLAIIILDAGIERCDDQFLLRFSKAALCLHIDAFEIARSEVQSILQKHPTDEAVKQLARTIESVANLANAEGDGSEGDSAERGNETRNETKRK